MKKRNSHSYIAPRRKHRLQRTVIAQAKFADGVQVLRLHGAKRIGGKDMIEAILEAVPVTPAPSLLPCLLGIAMQPPIDIVQIVAAQLTQHAAARVHADANL